MVEKLKSTFKFVKEWFWSLPVWKRVILTSILGAIGGSSVIGFFKNMSYFITLIAKISEFLWKELNTSTLQLRLEKNNFGHFYEHIQLDGGDVAPLECFDLVYDFLDENFKVE